MFRWSVFFLSLAVLVMAMAWISLRALELESQRQAAAAEAVVQERLRLALWRMDALASALLIRENARPPWHYRPFYQPEDAFSAKNEALPRGSVVLPSPLLAGLPDLVRLHFERSPEGVLTSPQAPAGAEREQVLGWYAVGSTLQQAEPRLQELSGIFTQHPDLGAKVSRLDEGKDTAPPVGTKPESKAHEPQAEVSMREQMTRNTVIIQNVEAQKSESLKLPLLKRAAPPVLADASAVAVAEEAAAPSARRAPGGAPPAAAAPSSSAPGQPHAPAEMQLRQSADALSLSSISSRYRGEGHAVAEAELLTEKPTLAGDLRALWLGEELLLVRRVVWQGQERLQGAWLDWPGLRQQLLLAVRDLLPAASLLPVPPETASMDPAALVTLPVRVIPGVVPAPALGEGFFLKPALALAWLCLLAAATAIAFVLHRAMSLSERRAAFVSAVTHELRTPLTTFRLYSEMLADDMVPDAEQRRGYLQTLCDESTRLMHLVENVLSFSRIERGRTAARLEEIHAGVLLERMLPRLRQRAAQADLEIQTCVEENARAASVRVDALAVEQILFNLTDNACKYAAPDCEIRLLILTVTVSGSYLALTLRDHGPGLPAGQRRRLFQPFSKSATEAAHSAPGVGLGLALSRRLARELGGELENLAVKEGRGTCFRLRLRLVRTAG